MPDHLDVETGVVTDAGRRTAATAEQWSSWGDRIRSSFDFAREEVCDNTIRAALETYGSEVERGARHVAANVETLGVNTTSAAHTIADADATAADTLTGQGRGGAEQAEVLRRPINGPVPV